MWRARWSTFSSFAGRYYGCNGRSVSKNCECPKLGDSGGLGPPESPEKQSSFPLLCLNERYDHENGWLDQTFLSIVHGVQRVPRSGRLAPLREKGASRDGGVYAKAHEANGGCRCPPFLDGASPSHASAALSGLRSSRAFSGNARCNGVDGTKHR